MNKYNFLIVLIILGISFASCEKDEDEDEEVEMEMTVYDYHAHINSPDAANKHVGDTIVMNIEFESHTGETVHHINVRIVNVADSTEIYNQPDMAHIHEEDGNYSFTDTFVMSLENGVSGHTDWRVEAKVWGHESGEEEETETLQFHVHP